MGYLMVKTASLLRSLVLTQYRNVTDRRTDGQIDRRYAVAYTAACKANFSARCKNDGCCYYFYSNSERKHAQAISPTVTDICVASYGHWGTCIPSISNKIFLQLTSEVRGRTNFLVPCLRKAL